MSDSTSNTEIRTYSLRIGKGEKISLNVIGLSDEDLKQYEFSSSDIESVSVDSNGIITANTIGESTITLYQTSQDTSEKQPYASIKIYVYDTDEYISSCIDLSKKLTISEDLRNKLINDSICSLDDIIRIFGTNGTREINSRKYGIGQYEAGLYFCQAVLAQIPAMTKDFSYLAALAGVRNPFDLSRVNAQKLNEVIGLLKNSVMAAHPEITFPDYSSILDMIASAKDMNSKYYSYYYEEGGLPSIPDILISNNEMLRTDSQIINEGLKFLENRKPALPLPRTISGTIQIKKGEGKNAKYETKAGLLVSISGISNPAQDKTEDEKEYSCYTGPDGTFIIALPDKYNMQDTITISVSVKNNMTYAVAGKQAISKAEFVKRASEILKNEYITVYETPKISEDEPIKVEKKASDILRIINEVRGKNTKAMEAEKILRQRAYYEYALEDKQAKQAKINGKIAKCKKEIENEVAFHIGNYKKDIDKLIVEKDQELSLIVDTIYNTYSKLGITFINLIFIATGIKLITDFIIKKGEENKASINLNELQIREEVFNSSAQISDELKNELVQALETFKTQFAEYQEKLKKEEDNSSDKYAFLYYFENTYVPDFSSFFQSLIKTIYEVTAKINKDIDINEFDKSYYSIEPFLNPIGSLAELCDCNPYFEIKERYKAYEQIKIDWQFILLADRDNNAEQDEMSRLEMNHFSDSTDIDPYESIINKLPAGCYLLEGKIKEYKNTKKELSDINEEIAFIKTKTEAYEEANEEEDYFTRYLDKLGGKEKETTTSTNSSIETIYKNYIDDIQQCNDLMDQLGCIDTIITYNKADYEETNTDEANESKTDNVCTTSKQIEQRILNFLSAPMDSRFPDIFIIDQDDFEDDSLHPRALPSVKLMGDGSNEIYLPTDTAPSRVFNYTMVHRLVEPKIKKNGIIIERSKFKGALNVQQFKNDLIDNHNNIALADTLGIGYSLNMHQAWVPDGFALGNLLYSLILAPGEEQRIIVREHKEFYSVSDEGNVTDRVHDMYLNSQIDNEAATFNNAVGRYSGAHSDSSYYSNATSDGYTGIIGLGASSSATSTNSGSGSASTDQRDSYDEASHAAQDFQTDIKTESERLSSENRTIIRTATSEESEAVSSRIIANHNHSHVMTVQYWEVARRYRLESCIDGVELLLFVPLELIRFMPQKPSIGVLCDFFEYNLKLDKESLQRYDKSNFELRYGSILEYYDILEKFVPYKYKSGLNLIKKFSAIPYWNVEQISQENLKYTITLIGGICEFDNISATVYFNNGARSVKGIITKFNPNKLLRDDGKLPHTYDEVVDAIIMARSRKEGSIEFTFTLPYGCVEEDISCISLKNDIKTWNYKLSQSEDDMSKSEIESVKMYRIISRTKGVLSGFNIKLPECYESPIKSFSSNKLYSLGELEVELHVGSVKIKTVNSFMGTVKDWSKIGETGGLLLSITNAYNSMKKLENSDETINSIIASGTLGRDKLDIYVDNTYPKLRLNDIQKIEETFHHIVSNTMFYSQKIWASLTDDERILLLEPYTIEFDDLDKIASPENSALNLGKSKNISLLNCVNAKKVIGFYGNCMMLPFTFPQELAELLGKTAGDIQNELYRYHSCNFRVPSTVISVPTDGMVGEAVLGSTNVSEKIDITRFWNWKDSDIDHIDLNQSSLNGRSLLENANTKDIIAPTVGVTATEHISGNNLASDLVARQQPTFADVYTNTDMREVMKNADNNASAGREQVVQSTSDLAKSALDTVGKLGSAAATGGISELLGGAASGTLGNLASGALSGGASGALGGLASGALGDVASAALGGGASGGITNLLGALGDAGLGDSELGKLFKDGLGANGSLGEVAKSLVGMVGGGESDALKKALDSIGGDNLKSFLSNFVEGASADEVKSLEENFRNSLTPLIGDPGKIDNKDIMNMAEKFCNENGIKLSEFSNFLGKQLGLY